MKSLSSATIIISYLVLSISCNHLPIDTYSNNDINDVTVSEFDLMASSNICKYLFYIIFVYLYINNYR